MNNVYFAYFLESYLNEDVYPKNGLTIKQRLNATMDTLNQANDPKGNHEKKIKSIKTNANNALARNPSLNGGMPTIYTSKLNSTNSPSIRRIERR